MLGGPSFRKQLADKLAEKDKALKAAILALVAASAPGDPAMKVIFSQCVCSGCMEYHEYYCEAS